MPATASTTPLRVHVVSPSMKLLAGQRMMSRPCSAHNPPTSTIATPTIARMPFNAPVMLSLCALQSDQRPQPADVAPDGIEKPASRDGRCDEDSERRQRGDVR